MKIRFISIKNGDNIDFGNIGLFGVSGDTKYLGFKPGRTGKPEGWLVVAVGESGAPKKHQKKNGRK